MFPIMRRSGCQYNSSVMFHWHFFAVVLKPSFSQSFFVHSHLHLLRMISENLTTRCLVVTGGSSVGECGRLSQPSWLFGTLEYSYTYLLTYIMCVHAPCPRLQRDREISWTACTGAVEAWREVLAKPVMFNNFNSYSMHFYWLTHCVMQSQAAQ